MLTSLALVFLCGLLLGGIMQKLGLPALLGMLVTGMILGPYGLHLLSDSLLSASGELRQLALIIILARAGLNLDLRELKKVGRPAILMCFVPACFEIVGMVILAPPLLGVSVLDAAIMGAVVGAVSPAVIVPRMLHLMEQGHGTDKSIPQMILAGASVDDVVVIVLFTSFLGLAQGGSFSPATLFSIPLSIFLGLGAGVILGLAFDFFFQRYHCRDSIKVLIFLSLSFLLVALENSLKGTVAISGLLGVMSMGIVLRRRTGKRASRLSQKFSKLWVGAELMLFVLVGTAVDIRYALSAGGMALLVIAGVLVMRIVGVLVCLLGSSLNKRERLFSVAAYLPKATVQAAIGSVPLSLGLSCGNMVLTVAILAILITAPLGAILMDRTYQKLLSRTPQKEISENLKKSIDK